MLSLKGRTVLIVEDEPDFRELLGIYIKSFGAQTFTASNGKEGFQFVCDNHVDIVISDIRMPEWDGLTMLKHLRKRDPMKPVVILITGESELTEKVANEKGANAVLQKPFRMGQLRIALSQCFEKLRLGCSAA